MTYIEGQYESYYIRIPVLDTCEMLINTHPHISKHLLQLTAKGCGPPPHTYQLLGRAHEVPHAHPRCRSDPLHPALTSTHCVPRGMPSLAPTEVMAQVGWCLSVEPCFGHCYFHSNEFFLLYLDLWNDAKCRMANIRMNARDFILISQQKQILLKSCSNKGMKVLL